MIFDPKPIMENWKTTCAGVALLAVTVMYFMGKVPTDGYMAAVATLGALGLMAAKDSK